MKIGASKIVVANTNTTEKEMQPYFDMAKQYGYRTFFIIVESGWNKTKSIHNVPNESIEKMKNRFDVRL